MSEVGELDVHETGPDEVLAFPLTTQQRHLWRLDGHGPSAKGHTNAFRLEVNGVIDPQILGSTLAALVARHESLRSACGIVNHDTCLVIDAEAEVEFSISDLREAGVAEAERTAEELCAHEAGTQFHLLVKPLVRFRLIRVTPTRSIITLTFHKFVADGWSTSILIDELSRIYAALALGYEPDLPDLALQFGDYAAWHQEYIASPEARADIDDWVSALSDYKRFDVPGDQSPGGTTDACGIVTRELPKDLTDTLARTAAARGDTMFVVGAGACLAALHDMTGQPDIAMAVPVAGRDSPELEDIVGPLVNHVLLRTKIAASSTLSDVLADVRSQMLEKMTARTAPIELVAEAVAASTGTRQEPFFSVCFSCQQGFAGARSMTYDFAGLGMKTLPSMPTGALHDLFFFMVERETGWRLSLDYRAARFSRGLAERLLDALATMLRRIVSHPDAPIGGEPSASISEPAPGGEALSKSAQPDAAPVLPADAQLILPANAAQQRYWLLAQALPDSSAFNMAANLAITGPLDVDAFQESLGIVIARHEALRTSFEEVDGELSQLIAPQIDPVVPLSDLTAKEPRCQESSLADLLAEEARKPFDMAKAPLLRVHVVRLSPTDSVLALTFHHSVSDGHSIAIVQRELWHCYASLIAGQTPDLAPVRLQYGDFAASHNAWMETPEAGQQLAYWTDRLSGTVEPLDVPLDREPTTATSDEPAIVRRPLPAATTALIKSTARHLGTTAFAITSAAFAALLARCSHQSDVIFACPTGNRNEETTGIVGPFAGLFALRLQLGDDPTFEALIERASDGTMEGIANSDIPLESILATVRATRRYGRNPLFQFFFVYQVAFLQALRSGPLELRPLPSLGIGTRYEIQFSLIERPSDLSAEVEYNNKILDEATVETLIDDYLEILSLCLEQPSVRISELPDFRAGLLADGQGRTRWTRATQDAQPAGAQLPRVDPQSDLALALSATYARVLGVPEVGFYDSFFDLGGTSVRVLRLIREIKIATGLEISAGLVFRYPTIAEMLDNLKDDQAKSASVVVPLNVSAGTGNPVFCLCGIELYSDLARGLEKEGYPVSGIYVDYEDQITQLLAQGISPKISLSRLANDYVDAILRQPQEGPYRLAGISAGGIVAIEAASLLRRRGKEVQSVVILDTALAHGMRRNWGRWLADKAGRLAAGELTNGVSLSGLARRGLSSTVHRRTGAPANADFDAKALDLDELKQRAFGDALRQWQPVGLITDFKVILYRAIDEIRQLPQIQFDEDYGWRRMLSGTFIVEDVPGSHLTMVRPPYVDALARSISGHLRPES